MPQSSHSPRLCRVPGSQTWQECLAAQSGATPFHEWPWLRVMAGALHCHFLPLGFYQDADLVGLLPLLVRQRGPYKSANWVPFPYLGPLVPTALLPASLRALDDYQRGNGIGLMQLGFAPHAAIAAADLLTDGYSTRTDATMIVPLAGRTEAEVWAGLEGRGRGSVRKAQKEGVRVEQATEREITRELPAILREVFARRGQPAPYDEAALRALWAQYHDDPCARLVTAHYAGEAAAVLISLRDQQRAYLCIGGGRFRHRQINPNALLYWDAICWARAAGCAAIDMVGNPEDGIAKFKASFGSVTTPYVVANRESSRLAAWARRTYGRALLLGARSARTPSPHGPGT